MGFKIICLFFALSAYSICSANAQCPGCKQALLTDYLLGSENTEEQMLVIHLIDKNIFTALKKNYPADSIATLVYEMIQASRDFEAFSKKRDALFAFASFSVADENTEAQLFNISHSSAYENYEKCIDACNSKIPDKVYAVLNRADENLFYVSVKFNTGSGSKSFVNLVLKAENAMILSQDASRYSAQVAMKLLKGKELFFTFKRSDKYNVSGFKMWVDGKETGNGYTLFKEAAPKSEISATLNITAKDSVKKFVKTEIGLINSPNLYKVLSNDTACRRLRGYAVKEWCAVKNTIELPKLPDKNIYYTNFSKLKAISEGKKEQAYGKFNEMSGLSKIQKIGPGNKTARYEFVTTSGGCLWQWKADVFEFSEKLSKQQKPVVIKNKLFVLELNENWVEASITLKINGNKFEMKAGSNSPEAMTYLISESRKNGLVRYVYYVL